MKFISLSLAAILFVSVNADCNRYYNNDSFACVCNAQGCDYPGRTPQVAPGEFLRIISSRDEYRLDILTGTSTPNSGTNRITVYPSVQFQTIHGFGGAFTDSTGINVNLLSQELREEWVRSYFAPEGIEYDIGRVPVAGSDFSTYAYSYDETVDDIELNDFALAPEDYDYKLPYIKAAQNVSEREVLIFGSPWAPPPWMKENRMHNGSGGLLPNMWNPYSNYLIKFVEAYEAEGVPIWGLTPVNEPLVGFEDWPWNACAFSGEDMRDWIKTSFGPLATAAGILPDLTLMIYDHNADGLAFPDTVLSDPDAAQYVDGTAVHWYADEFTSPQVLTDFHNSFPDYFIMYTEACEGWHAQADERVVVGSWQRAENYAANILGDLENWSTGWIDWNLALSITGGPNWAGNYVDAPTLITEGVDEFLKQPTFYAMGHFSKFLTPGSVRLQTTVASADLQVSSYQRPEGDIAIVILNKSNQPSDINLEIIGRDPIEFAMNAKSIETLLIG